MNDFRLRQVHLDFHTSPLIPGVGAEFNKEEWQATLKLGHVDSITVFSKCHHGYSFHPTSVNEMHPNLSFDLLGAQLEACKEIGVRAPVYISAGFDEKDAVCHHEWLFRDKEHIDNFDDMSNAGYHLLCLNTPYLDKLLAEIAEVMARYNPCGIFLDILDERRCYCSKCRADMNELGMDYHNDEDVKEFSKKVYRNFMDSVEKTVRKYSENATIFFNGGHILMGRRELLNRETHLELESLPTGGWGYDHFPRSASYAATLGYDFLGMTGKFHKSWGEFGGFKHPNALRYETALSLAMGAGCSIGDQMHPDGRLNKSTYSLIGKAYKEVEQKEPWCKGAKRISDIAVLGNEAVSGERGGENALADTGANRILLETHRLYSFIDSDEDFSKYKLLILPDVIQPDEGLGEKINSYLKNGGKLLLSGKSGTDENGDFCVDTGIVFKGANEYRPNYFIPDFETVNGVTEYIMREQSYLFENVDARIIAYGQNPYFNRTPEHFCSHQHAPNDRSLTYPTASIKGGIAYIGWEVFKGYAIYGDLHHKELVSRVIDELTGDDLTVTTTNLPDRGIVSATKQDGRMIIHLLFAHTTIRGRDTEVIEDVVPVYNINVSVKSEVPKRILLVPENKPLEFYCENGNVSFTVPKLLIHQMVSIEY